MFEWLDYLRCGASRLAVLGGGLLFPPCCAVREEALPPAAGRNGVCATCQARMGVAWNACRRCAGRLGGVVATDRCPLCRNTPLQFDAAVALGGYHTELRETVLRMKRPAHEGLSRAMGQLLAQQRHEQLQELAADLIVPIPMFWSRRLGRGINNPDILGRCLGKSLALAVRRDVLVRCINTPPQAHLPPSRRFQNVRGAFRVRRGHVVQDRTVLLVDDVLTTGATCSEAAKTLKKAGAARVVVAVVARAQGKDNL